MVQSNGVATIEQASHACRGTDERNRIQGRLEERIKELAALQRISAILRENSDNAAVVLNEVAAVLPPGFQWPDLAEARVVFDGETYATPGFRPSPRTLSVGFRLKNGCEGRVEVAYVREAPEADGTFIPEEKVLLRTVADMLRCHLERRAMEESLKTGEQRYRRIVDTSHEGICLIDRNSVIEFANARLGEMLGYSVEELVGRNLGDLVEELDHEVGSRKPPADRQRAVRRYDVRLRCKGGSTIWGIMCESPLQDERGHFIGSLGMVLDITDRKRAELALRESESRFRTLVANIPGLVFRSLCDHEWTMLFLSEAVEGICGYPASEFLNGQRTWLSVMHPDDRESTEKAVLEAIGKREPYLVDYRILHADGSTRWLYEKGQGVFSPSGELLYLDGVIFDITKRRRAEELLRIGMAAIDATDDMIVIADRHGTIEYVNPSFTRETGYAPGEVLGRNMALLHSREEADAWMGEIQRALSLGQTWRGTSIGLRKDGSRYPTEITLSPITDAAGRVVRYVSVKRDVTQRQRTEELEQEQQTLQQAVRALEQVLGVIGHELRTPLAAIRAIAELLLMQTSGIRQDHVKLIASINEEVVRMAQMVNDLLEVARLNSGTMRWNWSRFSLRETCEEALATIRPLLDPSRVQLTAQLEPDFEMTGDGAAIRRLLVNLLNNAQKHTREGSIHLEASKQVEEDGEWVHIEVTDTGEGLTPNIAAKIGEAFTLNSGVVGDRFVRGSGLGLAICRGIVTAHGGTIAVRSRTGKGTCVAVRIRADLPQPIIQQRLVEIDRSITS